MKIEHGVKFGDLKKFSVHVNGKDISEAVTSAHVFQDMFAPTTTAVVKLADTTNLLMTIPIRPGSTIKIELETDLGFVGDGSQTWDFIIHKVGDKSVDNSKHQTYSLYAADKSFVVNQTKRISRSFKNKLTTEIVSTVITEFLGENVDLHKSDNKLNVIVPMWTPFYTMSWLLKTSFKDNAADYAFYQKWDRTFAFKSFEVLYTSKSEHCGITFKIRPTNMHNDQGDTLFDYSVIINNYHFDHFDALSNLASGFYKNKNVSYDFINKEWSEKTFTFGDDNPADKAMMQVDMPELLSSDEVNISFIPKYPKMFDSGESYLDSADTWQTSRKSALMKFNQEKLMIQFAGSAEAAKWFGQSCDVDLPAQDSLTTEQYDRKRRGRYVITAMAHSIGKDTYVINAELVKKRLEEK